MSTERPLVSGDVVDNVAYINEHEMEAMKLAGVTLTDNPPHPSWKFELIESLTCHCGEKLTVGGLLTFCPRYRRIGDDHVLKPNPRVVDQRGNLVRAGR